MRKHRYVILGGGVAAGYAAQEFAKHGLQPGDLALISADDTLPYERPPLSKGYLQGDVGDDKILINDENLYRTNDIAVYLETRVTRISIADPTLANADNRLFTSNGDSIGFEKLLITTGSALNTLDIPGADASGVHYLRSLDDAAAIRDDMEDAQYAVVIGGGYIGMEVAANLTQAGLQTTMVFPNDRLMDKRFFTLEMSDFFEDYFKAHGIMLLKEDRTTRIVKDGRRVSGVELASGTTLKADLVVAGIGVHPNKDLFEESRLDLNEGVLTNEYLESNVLGVYAAGDVAEYYDVLSGQRRRIEHWDNAQKQGQYAARRMLDLEDEPYTHLPYFFSDVFDLSYEFWGDAAGADDIMTRGSIDENGFSTWWRRDGVLIAAFVMGRPDAERQAAQMWIGEHAKVTNDMLYNVASFINA